MADKPLLLGIIIGIGLVFGLAFIPLQSDSAIPPTPAFSNIKLDGVWNNATSYRDSIEINTSGGLSSTFGANSTVQFIGVANNTHAVIINGTDGSVAYINTDKDAAIQATLDFLHTSEHGGQLTLKAGNWTGGAISIGNNTELRGEGWGSVYKAEAGTTTSIFQSKNPSTNIIISDLRIDGNKANTGGTSRCINMQTENILVLRVYVHDCFSHGIVLRNSANMIISHSLAEDNGGDGFKIGDTGQPSRYGFILNSIARDNGDTGLILENTERGMITNSISENNDHNLIIDSSQDWIVANNILNYTTTGYSFLALAAVGNVSEGIISNNIITGSAKSGIELQSTSASWHNSHIFITNNKIYDNSRTGGSWDNIKVREGHNIIISTNEIYNTPDGNSQWGIAERNIQQDGVSDSTYYNNYFDGNIQGEFLPDGSSGSYEWDWNDPVFLSTFNNFTNHLSQQEGNRFYFDNDFNSYFLWGNNVFDVYTNGFQRFKVDTAGGGAVSVFNADLNIPSGREIHLDGLLAGDSYLVEATANNVNLTAGGDNFQFNTTGLNMEDNQLIGSMGCSDGDQLNYNSSTNLWECEASTFQTEQSSEQNANTQSTVLGSNNRAYFVFTLPSDYDYYIITKIEWKNGDVVGGTMRVGADLSYTTAGAPANPIVYASTRLAAISNGVIQSGVNVTQSMEVISFPVPAGSAVAAWIATNTATSEYRSDPTFAASQPIRRAISWASDELVESTGFSSSTERFYMKVYYKGMG